MEMTSPCGIVETNSGTQTTTSTNRRTINTPFGDFRISTVAIVLLLILILVKMK